MLQSTYKCKRLLQQQKYQITLALLASKEIYKNCILAISDRKMSLESDERSKNRFSVTQASLHTVRHI